MIDKDYMVSLENKFQGYGTRIKELHFSASSISVHKLIDEFDGEFKEFEDAIMENMQALFGFILPGTLSPVLPEAMEFEDLLEDLRGVLAGIKRECGDSIFMSGIVNLVDDFFTTVNRYIYLIKIAKKEND